MGANFVAYIRISKMDSTREISLGAQSQIEDVRRYCESNHGVNLVKVFVEDGASGRDIKNRPVFKECLDYIRKNRGTGLIVKNVTRLSRNIGDVVNLFNGPLSGVKVISLDMVSVDFQTPNGMFVLLTFANFAQYEKSQIGIRTKNALSILKSQGVKLGNPELKPYGDNEKEKIVLSVIKAMLEAGYGYNAIARTLNERGLRNRAENPFASASVRNLATRHVSLAMAR